MSLLGKWFNKVKIVILFLFACAATATIIVIITQNSAQGNWASLKA